MPHLVGMHSHRGVDEGVLIGELNSGTAGGEITSDGDEGVDARLPSPLNHRLAIVIEARIVEMGVGIDQHRREVRGSRC